MSSRKLSDLILKTLIFFCSFLTIGILAWIVVYIVSNGILGFSFDFIADIAPKAWVTLYIVLFTVVIATPIGIGAAIYLVEYSKPGVLLSTIRFATECLSGIPSIIYGLFGLIFFVTILQLQMSITAGALTLSIMVLPTIIRTTEEALKSVPCAYKEGSLALGATKLETIMKVVLPCAIPGILTAIILSIGRIVGETAAVYFTAGTALGLPLSPSESGRTLSVHLYLLAKEGISFEQAFATATLLVVIVALINMIANRIASNIKRVTMGH